MHFSDRDGNRVNSKAHSGGELFDLYIRNAVVLALTLKRHGYGFILHTNNTALCGELLDEEGRALVGVREIEAHYSPPEDIKFYSAHQKLNLYRTLAGEVGNVHCVVDLDMVMLKKLPDWLGDIWNRGLGAVYDISCQVLPSVGHERVRSDLARLTGFSSEGRWFGGEFISGTPAFWAKLCARIESYWPAYLANYQGLSHQGDEALSSAAFQVLGHADIIAVDVGTFDVVKRHWSVCTHHQQPSLCGYMDKISMLHLPADKPFIASCGLADFNDDNAQFWRRYKAENRKRRFLSVAKHMLKPKK